MTAGRLVLMGSGELAPGMVAVHREAMTAAGSSAIAVLDSPFGFQENVEVLTQRIVEFFQTSLSADVEVASLRNVEEPPLRRERALAQVRAASTVFAGPGSPSYALRVWKDVGMGEALSAVLAGGGTVTLASAAAVTAGVWSIPVYEIYKVGEDPHWLEGLDLLSPYGVPAVVVPHWNNTEGGNHDTSRCYIGERRLRLLEREIDVGIIGIDEHTSATIDLATGSIEVAGRGEVTIRGEGVITLIPGTTAGLEDILPVLTGTGRWDPAPDPDAMLRPFAEARAAADVDGMVAAMLAAERDEERRGELRSMLVEIGEVARTGVGDPRQTIAGFVDLLLDVRDSARRDGRYEESDLIRDRLADLGVEVRDTQAGPVWEMAP